MRITCPECETVLRPAKPLPIGKKVKCPKCGSTFAIEADEADEPPKKTKEPAPPATVKKKIPSAPPPEKKPVQPAARAADEDDEGGTYSLFSDAEKKEGEDEPEAIKHGLDTSIKDLRGPTQETVMQPTNVLLGIGVGGFIGWMAMLIIFSIPVLFPVEPDEGTKDRLKPVLKIPNGFGSLTDEYVPGSDAKKGSTEKSNVSFFQVFGYDFGVLFGSLAWYMFILAMIPVFLGMAYSGVQTYGVVRTQNLESRQWGIAACIMTMVPINLGGVILFVCMLISFLLNMILDDMDTINYMIYGAAIILTLGQIAAGVYLLRILMRPEIIAGFEYVPDHESIPGEKKSKPRRKKRK